MVAMARIGLTKTPMPLDYLATQFVASSACDPQRIGQHNFLAVPTVIITAGWVLSCGVVKHDISAATMGLKKLQLKPTATALDHLQLSYLICSLSQKHAPIHQRWLRSVTIRYTNVLALVFRFRGCSPTKLGSWAWVLHVHRWHAMMRRCMETLGKLSFERQRCPWRHKCASRAHSFYPYRQPRCYKRLDIQKLRSSRGPVKLQHLPWLPPLNVRHMLQW